MPLAVVLGPAWCRSGWRWAGRWRGRARPGPRCTSRGRSRASQGARHGPAQWTALRWRAQRRRRPPRARCTTGAWPARPATARGRRPGDAQRYWRGV